MVRPYLVTTQSIPYRAQYFKQNVRYFDLFVRIFIRLAR